MSKKKRDRRISKGDVGWVFLPGARRAHYFRDGVSLCGVWGYWGRCFVSGRYELAGRCKECVVLYASEEKQKIFDPSTDAWLAEYDWKKEAAGDHG